MMLRPNHLKSETLNRTPYRKFDSVQPDEKNNSTVELPEVSELLESLVSKDISPAKRAIIEQLVASWVEESKPNVA